MEVRAIAGHEPDRSRPTEPDPGDSLAAQKAPTERSSVFDPVKLNDQGSAPPSVLRRALTSLRPAYRRTSSGFGPAAAPGLLFGGDGTSSHRRRWVGRPAAELLPPDPGAPSVVLRKDHRGEGPFPLTTDVVGDDPDLAVLGREVAGEEAPIAAAGSLVVGGHVVLADLAPVAGGMSIEQSGDLVMGHGGSHGGGGHHAAEVGAHGFGAVGRES